MIPGRYFEKNKLYDQVRFIPGMQGWLHARKVNITIHYINGLNERNHMINSQTQKRYLIKITPISGFKKPENQEQRRNSLT